MENSTSLLLKEYDHLTHSFRSVETFIYGIPPVVVGIVCGLVISRGTSTQLLGFGLPMGVAFIGIWYGICHSLLNYYGLRIVEVEQEINLCLQADSPFQMKFFSNFVAEGNHIVEGFRTYSILLGVFVVIVFGLAGWSSWYTTSAWDWELFPRIAVILMPIMFTLTAVITMIRVELKVRNDKMLVIESFKSKKEKMQEKDSP